MLIYALYVFLACANPASRQPDHHDQVGIVTDIPCDSIPPLNKKINAYVAAHLNKKIGKGECWDLAAGALNTHKAIWNGQYIYGQVLDHISECVYPGDIIQFENVRIETVNQKGRLVEEMSHHTAIVHEVHSTGYYTIGHQNYNNTRKVILTTLNMENITKGKVMIYRPQAGVK